MSQGESIYITTPVFYPNDKPHLGHAFTVVLADCLKRYYSSLGYKCWMSVGTDEHGEKIFKAAESKGIPVEEFIDGNVSKFKELWNDLGIKYDRFMRTSDNAHKQLVRKIFEQFENTNQIYVDEWKGWYCTSCEEGYSYRSISKTAVCKLGHALSIKNERTFFLRVVPFKAWLMKEYQERDLLIYPSHYKKEMINNFINDLDDLSITRGNVDWGIKVPDREDQTIYVWFDALIGYLSALHYGNFGKGAANSQHFHVFWESPGRKVIHIIGKEICRFHSIYWPIMLKNLNLELFDTLLVHGWLLMNNDKMSKSKQNVIDPVQVINDFSREALRFYLSKFNFLVDNQVSMREIQVVYNSYLANTFGNLISRFYGIVSKKFDLQVPDDVNIEEFIEIDQLNIQIGMFLDKEYEEYVEQLSPYLIVEKVFDLFRTAGKLIEKNKAWELPSDSNLLKSLMHVIYKLLCVGTWSLSPILIDSYPEIFDVLNVSHKKANLEYLKKDRLYSKKTINPLNKVFFPRITISEYE
ncbi:methionine--tRNA ligase [Candidatus Mycoplasma haematohominis]|uniref:Methionine--tRNA ligase n=1 Tax=Candidatus Mycoplasma haematohominis TaxID=1494318 RepID=A0A478FPS6_9MOLU|nr:methionine--tRNA ligase [Candidatus Mycoplasma haemohominis]GCE63232.1 methionine--tRNA ligase [Candidatus Mycoplasma haemohominis]